MIGAVFSAYLINIYKQMYNNIWVQYVNNNYSIVEGNIVDLHTEPSEAGVDTFLFQESILRLEVRIFQDYKNKLLKAVQLIQLINI